MNINAKLRAVGAYAKEVQADEFGKRSALSVGRYINESDPEMFDRILSELASEIGA